MNNLRGLNGVQSVHGFLQIVNNQSLSNLTGLNALREVKGLLQVYNNPSLNSLTGIDSIDHETINSLAILSCPELTKCSVKSICDYLKVPTNLANIDGNEIRCNSRENILDYCTEAEGNNIPAAIGVLFYPNPTSGIVNI